MVAAPPRDEDGKRFYAEPDRAVARVAALKATLLLLKGFFRKLHATQLD